MVREHHPLVIQIPAAIFKAPFYQRPEVHGNLPVGTFQTVAAGAVGCHCCIASVAGSVPDIVALGNYGTGDGLVGIVHKTGILLVAVVGRFHAGFVAGKREKRVHVFALVVAPECGIIGFAARGVHQAAFGGDYALAGAQFGIAEFGVYNLVRSIQYQIVAQLFEKVQAGGVLGREIDGVGIYPFRLCLILFVGLHHQEKETGFARLQGGSSAVDQLYVHHVAALDALCGVTLPSVLIVGNIQFHRLVRDVFHIKQLINGLF